MKRLLLLMMLIIPTFAVTYNWDYWEERCADGFSDFLIYGLNSSYRGSTGMMVLNVEPKVDVLKYVPQYSESRFADFARPLIPGFDYPSTIPLRISTNYTFFVPFGFSDNDLSIQVVANNSEGYPKCSSLSWPVNDTHKMSDVKLSMGVVVSFNPQTHKFEYNLTNGEESDVRVFFSVFSGSKLIESSSSLLTPSGNEGDNVKKSSQLTYKNLEVASGTYEIYVTAVTPEKSFYLQQQIFEFYDFELSVPEVPNFRPGSSYDLTLTLKNTGYKTDSYDFNVSTADGWEYSIGDPGELDKGQDNDLKLSYTVPELQVGNEVLNITVTSTRSGKVKSYEFSLSPEKITTLEVSTRDIQELSAYSNNNMSVVVISSGTVNPEMYYFAYTEPALFIRDGMSSMTANVGEVNKKNLNFYVGGSCAMSSQDSLAFNAGRKTLMFSKAIYFLSSNLDAEKVSTISQIGNMVDAEKLKMTSINAGKLFSSAESLGIIINKIIDGFAENKSMSYFNALREDLYLYTVDLDSTLSDVGSRMSESCSSVDEVTLRLYALDLSTLKIKDIPKTVGVKGPKVLELIGPSKLKAISGSTVYFDYILKNNAGEDFEVDITPSSDMLLLPAFIYLPADSSKDLELRVRPPKYFEADELVANVELKTRTYSLKFPLTISAGLFDPSLVTDSDYAFSPGTENTFNISLRTGGLDDTFKINVNGPSWVTGPERVITKNGEAEITLLVNPPLTASDSEFVEITAYSEAFPEYVSTESFDIFVSSGAESLLDKMNQDLNLLDSKVDLLSQKQYIEAGRYLSDAKRDISQNEFNSAKLNLKRAENIIFSVNEDKSSHLGLYIAGGVLIIGIGVFWKFLLPKIKGTPSAPQETDQEVI